MRAQGWNRKAFAWLAVGLVVAVLCMGLALNAEKIARAIGQLGPRPTTGEVDEGVVSAVPAAPVRDVGYTSWDAEIYPQYYRVVGQAVVDLDIPAGETWYAPLDELGRARRAAAMRQRTTITVATLGATSQQPRSIHRPTRRGLPSRSSVAPSAGRQAGSSVPRLMICEVRFWRKSPPA